MTRIWQRTQRVICNSEWLESLVRSQVPSLSLWGYSGDLTVFITMLRPEVLTRPDHVIQDNVLAAKPNR